MSEQEIPVPAWVLIFNDYMERIGDWEAKVEEHLDVGDMPPDVFAAYEKAVEAAIDVGVCISRWTKKQREDNA